MKRISVLVAVAAAVALLAAGPVSAENIDVTLETGVQYAGHLYYDMATGVTSGAGPGTLAVGDVYSNTLSAANTATSTTDLNGIYGDEMGTTGTGLLHENDFTVYNPTTGGGTMASVVMTARFYDAANANFYLGGYITNPIAVALPGGYYTIVTVTGLDSLAINLPSTDIIETQQGSSVVGSSKIGIALLDPITIGNAAANPFTFYKSNSSSAAGWYLFAGSPNANVGYRLNVVPEPASMTVLAMGLVALARRRRRA